MHRGLILAVLGAALAAALAASDGALADLQANDYVTFRTPSRNIFCAYSVLTDEPAYLRCEIRSGIKPMPARPQNPECVWGRAVGMRKAGRPSYLCISDTVFDPQAKTLAYGSTWSRNGFRCSSQPAGLSCRNAAGHGFFLSREQTRLF